VVEPLQCPGGVDHGAHGYDVRDIEPFRGCPRAEAEAEVAAERESDATQLMAGVSGLKASHRTHDLCEPARVEQAHIEMLRFAVIAQIEPDDVEVPLEKMLSERHDVRRICTAFPAVKQNGHASNLVSVAIVSNRAQRNQAHTVAAVHEFAPRGGDNLATVTQKAQARPMQG
jgi:hypothetical protein